MNLRYSAAAVILLSLPGVRVLAQSWTQTPAPSTSWYSIASSADGATLAAADYYGGQVYRSTNSGATWAPTSAPVQWWHAVACSAEGSKLVAVSSGPLSGTGGPIFVSRDAGASWTQANVPDYYWVSVACSGDATRMVAVSSGDPRFFTNAIYMSTNSGASWTPADVPPQWWTSVASSADGSRLAATVLDGPIFISTDFGATWTPTNTPAQPWGRSSVAGSSGGTTLLTLAQDVISVSPNWGSGWTEARFIPSATWGSVACSADGLKLGAVVSGSPYAYVTALTSGDSGASWSESVVTVGTNICCMACSADGCKLAVAVNAAGIFVSKSAPTPVLHIKAAANEATLSWVVPSRNFNLQESANLLAWSELGVQPVLNYSNLHYEVSIRLSPGPHFFRLISQ